MSTPTAVPSAPVPANRSTPRIAPTLALALALRATPGAYALLLGSGISRSASIPTGWEVVLDLIRQIAPAGTDSTPAGLEAWYRAEHGGDPDYSTLLEGVAGTAAERRDRLRPYFEPTAEERADGKKVPTPAHRAIARLAARGYVRVIVTTNFDQLMETALRDEGITPAVISTADGVAGAMPVQHERVTVVKLHGDYTDTRIKNTPSELAAYDPAMDRLLDRVLDEYGLVVCGWSAAWDDALRDAITRAPNRRFSTYWATRGPLGTEATRLAEIRHAAVVDIESADAFFDAVAEHVATLEDLDRPHPLTRDVAVATFKRYLPRPEDRIRLDDLVMTEVDAARAGVVRVVAASGGMTNAAFVEAVPRIEIAAETLAALAAAGGYWGEPHHRPLWRKVIERAAPPPPERTQYTLPGALMRYLAQIAFYATGVAAAGAGHDDTVVALLLEPRIDVIGEGRVPPSVGLHVYAALEHDWVKLIPEHKQQQTPLSERLLERLRPAVAPLLADEDAYVAAFERFEIFVALAHAHETRAQRDGQGREWLPLGRSEWRHGSAFGNDRSALARMGEEIDRAGEQHVLVRHGLFDGSLDRLKATRTALVAQAKRRGF